MRMLKPMPTKAAAAQPAAQAKAPTAPIGVVAHVGVFAVLCAQLHADFGLLSLVHLAKASGLQRGLGRRFQAVLRCLLGHLRGQALKHIRTRRTALRPTAKAGHLAHHIGAAGTAAQAQCTECQHTNPQQTPHIRPPFGWGWPTGTQRSRPANHCSHHRSFRPRRTRCRHRAWVCRWLGSS